MAPVLQDDRCAFAFPTRSEYADRIGRVSRFDRAQNIGSSGPLVSQHLDGMAPPLVQLFGNRAPTLG